MIATTTVAPIPSHPSWLRENSSPTRSRQRLQLTSRLEGSGGGLLVNANSYLVPAGMRLVIEHIQCRVELDSPSPVQGRLVVTGSNSQVLSFDEQMAGSGDNEYLVNLRSPVLANSLSEVAFWLARATPNGRWTGVVTITGYLAY